MKADEIEKIDLNDYMLCKLKYKMDDEAGFTHNVKRDLQFIILWENGRSKEEKVLDEISNNFNIIYCAEVHWSEEHREANFTRLYTGKLNSKNNSGKSRDVGTGPFLCIVFEDEKPNYGYVRSLSGHTFIGNVNAVELKRRLRTLLNGNFVHGTAGVEEFFCQAILLFHEKKLRDILLQKSWDGNIHKIEQDLAGSNGLLG